MGIWFGTDGVRGVANEKLTPELAMKIGKAGAYVLAQKSNANKSLVLGRDTRISGDMLEAALVAGICSAGVDVYDVGVLPTPAIAHLTDALGTAGGVVISASHNPVEDNGIKFFGPSGHKLPDALEDEIEGYMEDPAGIPMPVGGAVGRRFMQEDAEDRYSEFLLATARADLAGDDLSGMKVVLDCANGASYRVAPRVIAALGAEVIAIHHTPDGVNINAQCGSTHPQSLMEKVVACGADLGLAFDGDADRMLAVDAHGQLVDGDQIMVICARYLKEKGLLPQDTVVVTVMSNLGLHLALQDCGIRVLQTKVGDRYVLEECLKSGAAFGGEQSGHILFLQHNTTGDGLLTGLKLLTVIRESRKTLAALAAQMERLPQILKNVKVENKQAVMNSQILQEAILHQEERLKGQGRILVRPSGTESLVRVMAEGRDLEELEHIIDELTKLVQDIA